MDDTSHRFHWIVLIVLILIAAAVRLYALGRAPLWLDEQCQLSVAQTPTIRACWVEAGKQGPIGKLSFVDTWITWHLGGQTRGWFRLPAALCGISTIPMLYILARRWFSDAAALYAAALLAVSGVHIQFSREARGYALLVFLSVLWAWLLDRFVPRPNWLGGVVLFLVAEIALQIHPAFLIVVAALTAAQLLALWMGNTKTDRTAAWHTSAIIGAIAMAVAAVYAMIPREMPVSTTNKPESDSLAYVLFDIYKTLLGGYWGFASYPVALLALAGAAMGVREKQTRRGTLCALTVALAGALPIVVGHSRGAAVFARYSLYALPFILMLPALGVDFLLKRWVSHVHTRYAAPVLLAAGLLAGMYIQGRSPYDLERFKHTRAERPSLER